MITVTPAVKAAMLSGGQWCYLLKLDMKSGPLYLSNAPHSINHGGALWLANGLLQYVDGIENTVNIKKGELVLGFDAVDHTMVAYVLNNDYRYREATLYSAMLDDDGQVIPDPTLRWVGEMVNHGISDAQKEPVVTISVNGAFSAMSKSNPWRTTPESHKRRYPNDEAFAFASKTLDTIEWGG